MSSTTNTNLTHIAIDGNEANIANRVGSNVYAFELLRALEVETRTNKQVRVTVLLRTPPHADFPKQHSHWQYKVIGPKPLWTQLALPIHLFFNRATTRLGGAAARASTAATRASGYDLLFSPGHYAPVVCPIPYVSSVMDTAYLEYPEQFRPIDAFQLTYWTKRAVSRARKIIAISQATKASVQEHYGKDEDDIVVAYPALSGGGVAQNSSIAPSGRTAKTGKAAAAAAAKAATPALKRFLQKNRITQPYVLFVGTLQPRKNISTLVQAFELLSTWHQKKYPKKPHPTLVLAGKVGWLADPIIKDIHESSCSEQIVQTGFISTAEKEHLYANATASVLIGLHEGFGIPPLEALAAGTPVVVSNTTSLPEVVGDAGWLANPLDPSEVAERLKEIFALSARDKAIFKRKAREQVARFDWQSSARTVLATLLDCIDRKRS